MINIFRIGVIKVETLIELSQNPVHPSILIIKIHTKK